MPIDARPTSPAKRLILISRVKRITSCVDGVDIGSLIFLGQIWAYFSPGSIWSIDPILEKWIWVTQGPMVPMVQYVQPQAPIIGILGGHLGTAGHLANHLEWWQVTRWNTMFAVWFFKPSLGKNADFWKAPFFWSRNNDEVANAEPLGNILLPQFGRDIHFYTSAVRQNCMRVHKKQIDCHWRFSMLPWFSDRLNRDVVVQSFWIWGARDPKKQLLVVALAASLLALCLSPGIHWVTINWSKKNETQQFNKRYYIYIYIYLY